MTRMVEKAVGHASIGRPQATALLAIAGVIAVVGCGPDDQHSSPPTTSFDQWDSAAVQISQTSGEALDRAMPWVLDTVPDLEIGTVDGEASYRFSAISSVAALPGGEIVVVDDGARNVRWFDPDGTFLRVAGRAGQGPGEFIRVAMVSQFQPDSLVVFDLMQRRLTSIALDGEWIRTQSHGESAHFLLAGRALVADGDRVLFQSPEGSCPSGADGVCTDRLFMHALDPPTETSDTIAVTTRRLFQTTEFGPGPVLLTIPFDPQLSAATDGRGFLLTTGEAFDIQGYGADGTLERIIRIDHAPLPLGADELEAAMREYVGGTNELSNVRRVFGQMEVRDTKPSFQGLRVDPLGWIWAERYRVDDAPHAEWVVFDPTGRAHGVMRIPSGLEVHDIGEHFVLGVIVDELGVERVRRHPLSRSGT